MVSNKEHGVSALGTMWFPSTGQFATNEDSPHSNREVPKESVVGKYQTYTLKLSNFRLAATAKTTQTLGLFLREKMILKNLSNTLPVARQNSPGRGRKPHEGSSTGTAVPGTKGLATASSHPLGQFHDSSVTPGAQGIGDSPTGPHHLQLHITDRARWPMLANSL